MAERPKPRRGFDIDGVGENCITEGLKVMNARLGTNFQYEEVTTYHWLYEKTLEITGDERLAHEVEDSLFDPEVLREAQPYPLAKVTLGVIHAIRDPYFITTRRPNCYDATVANLTEHFPWVIREQRLHMRRPGMPPIDGEKFKKDETVALDIEQFYEDRPETVRDLSWVTNAMLVDQPWNRQIDHDLDTRRVKGWLGILLNELKNTAS